MTIPAAISGFTTVVCSARVEGSAPDVWNIIGGFGDAGRFVGVPCQMVAGDGGLGSIRRIGDSILEALVGASSQSYTYVQTVGPMAPFGYHGTVAVSQLNATMTELMYTLVFDAATMPAGQAERETTRLQGRFQAAVDAMRDAAQLTR